MKLSIKATSSGFRVLTEKITTAMKTTQQILAYLLIPFILGLFSCEEEMPDVSGRNYIYELPSTSEQGIDGHMKIRERNDGSTQVELVLNGLDPDGTYPAYIHFNNTLEGGGIAITLTPVDGHSSNSVTEIRTLDSGTSITFEELREFDGHLNIQLGNDRGTIAAQADIGLNALTGRFQQFNLHEGDLEGVSGVLTIEERESGFSLITVQIEGSIPGKQHPVTLNFGSIHAKSGIAGTLNPVDGDTGIGKTHLEQLDGKLVAPYRALVELQGFIRIHMGTGVEMNTILAQGNIAFVEN
jgi:hypothetical protein